MSKLGPRYFVMDFQIQKKKSLVNFHSTIFLFTIQLFKGVGKQDLETPYCPSILFDLFDFPVNLTELVVFQ